MLLSNEIDAREPIHSRHANVEQHHLRARSPNEWEHLSPTVGLAENLEVPRRLQGPANAFEHQPVVVGEQNPDPAPRLFVLAHADSSATRESPGPCSLSASASWSRPDCFALNSAASARSNTLTESSSDCSSAAPADSVRRSSPASAFNANRRRWKKCSASGAAASVRMTPNSSPPTRHATSL